MTLPNRPDDMPGSTRPSTPAALDAGAAHRHLVESVASALRATRVLLLLHDGHGGRAVAAAALPGGGSATALVAAIRPWLDEAARTRRARLRRGPAGAPRDRQRSCIVAPLVDGRAVVGHLYADIDGASGRFGRAEREMLAALAAQAARAEAHRLESDRRAAQLAVIDSIQQGLVAQLDLQAVVELVGDRLREVFATDDLAIAWMDEQTMVATPAYFYEHGKRLHDVAPFPLRASGANKRMFAERIGVAVNADSGKSSHPVPGTQMPRSYMRAPVVAGDRVIAVVNVDDFERENAFSDDDVRLLTTVCTAMGMALQSAQLFDETQQLLKRDRAAQCRARGDQQHPAGARRRARPADHHRAWWARSCARSSALGRDCESGFTTPRKGS